MAGDVLLLFASTASTTALNGPGTGWTQVGRVVDTGHATTVWRRVATVGRRRQHGATHHERRGLHQGRP